ncbi:ATP-binding protein [Gimesia algae]|uniref:Recombination protein F n=1 Tax=Gimesia algae TaxID=2527971 RepID=A0A517VDK0_9PLAN|nr:ATP-binding protein [Gimesia algae]QDT91076.1 recombination protein F [Gimesia algae]
MTNETEISDLEFHTLDSLCKELISGRGIRYGELGEVFRFNSIKTRSIFNWYLSNRQKWRGQNTKTDVESIVRELETEPPEYENISNIGPGNEKIKWHLKSVRAHQFGGIHRNEIFAEKPPIFEYVCEAPLVIFEGDNGAGKSSVLSAICWCLTGYIYRAQKQPEMGLDHFDVSTVVDIEQDEDPIIHQIAKITPIPSSQVLASLDDLQVPIDTWVELKFETKEEREVTVRRSITRKKRSKKIEESVTGLKELGLMPIAAQIGTRMTGQIPFLQLNEKSDLSDAIADLTGLSPLKDLVTHAQKTKSKLDKDLPKDRDIEIENIDEEYQKERDQLAEHFNRHSELFNGCEIPHPSSKECAVTLLQLKQQFIDSQSQLLRGAVDVLGEGYNPDNQTQINDLVDNIGPAISLLKYKEDKRHLPSLNELFSLAAIQEEEVNAISLFLDDVLKQSSELEKLSSSQELDGRVRLYAKLGSWVRDQEGRYELFEECPVCETNIKDKKDHVVDDLILDQIEKYIEKDSYHLEQSIEQWGKYSTKSIRADFGAISKKVDTKLPNAPSEMISNALVNELFENNVFSDSLSPLKKVVSRLCQIHLPKLRPFVEPDYPELSNKILPEKNTLRQCVIQVYKILKFREWKKQNSNEITQVLDLIIGCEDQSQMNSSTDDTEESPLLKKLLTLKGLVTNQEPLQIAMNYLDRLLKLNTSRQEKESKKKHYSEASTAISELFNLSVLVAHQVDSVMKNLSENTSIFKDLIYIPAYTSAPRVDSTEVSEKGNLIIHAQFSGTRAEAHHFCNASDIRATLIALVFSLWKHLRETTNSLSLFLFDDIQELFDPINKWRLAQSMTKMVREDARVILTTNDQGFANDVFSSAEGIEVDHRQVLPAKANHQIIALNRSITLIHKKRKEFDDNKDSHEHAREYVKELRTYFECSFKDFFEVPVNDLPPKSTYADYHQAIRSRVNSGFDGFSSKVFSELAQDTTLQVGSDVYKLMNRAHHRDVETISYSEVFRVKNDLRRITNLVKDAHEEYERWLRRDPPLQKINETILELDKIDFKLHVPLIASLAASDGNRLNEREKGPDEFYSPDWLSSHTIFFNKSDNMGFAASPSTRLLVEASNSIPEDQSWVVAKHQERYLVRRVVYTANHYEMVTLIGESSDPKRRCPPLHLRKDEVLLFKVVGVLLDDSPDYRKTNSDALPDEKCRILEKVEKAFVVEGTSALPLALEGQLLLGGKNVLPSEFHNNEGRIVGLGTSEGNFLKRVGKSLNLPNGDHLRQFDSIGGIGKSFILRTEELEEDPYHAIPLIETATEILGVIYED